MKSSAEALIRDASHADTMNGSHRSGRILVADDDTPFREALLKFLSTEGYEPAGVPDAAATLEALRQEKFDLLIADIDMPGNTRLELIRELPMIAAGLPVILLTGSPSVETAATSVQLSVSAYLMKPPELGELRALMRGAIANHQVYRAIRSQWADLEALSREATRELAARPTGGGEAAKADDLHSLGAVLKNLLCAGVGSDTVAAHQLARHAELVHALHEAIAVLDRTKRAFKSKQLGALRQRLEEIVGHRESEQ